MLFWLLSFFPFQRTLLTFATTGTYFTGKQPTDIEIQHGRRYCRTGRTKTGLRWPVSRVRSEARTHERYDESG